MSEKELNSYRFLSGEDPSDEMLESIMREALKCAMKRKQEADKRAKANYERMRVNHKAKWESRLKSVRNG